MKYALLLLLFSVTADAQQRADTTFYPDIKNPRYPPAKGPVILLDEAHYNFHTSKGRFRPFAEFLRRDGYNVLGNTLAFSHESLKRARILVIANALHAVNQEEWTLPTPSAFSDEEIAALKEWVDQGGSLFLIADHMPFPGAAEKLAGTFGFTFYNGFAIRKDHNSLEAPDIFLPGLGLMDGPITRGTKAGEKVTSVRTFTGQAFDIPANAAPIIVLDERYEVLLPKTAWEFSKETPVKPAKGLCQGASLQSGKGRVVMFGEAAMFSAQIQGDTTRMGMNAPNARLNPQLLLNIIHWLDNGGK